MIGAGPAALAAVPPDTAELIKRDCRVDLFARLRKGTFVYLVLLGAIWGTTSYRQEHVGALVSLTLLVTAGMALRLWVTWPGRILSEHSSDGWLFDLSAAVLLLAAPFGVLLAHAVLVYGLSNWNFTILMIWAAGMTAGSLVSFAPNYKLLRLQVLSIIVPATLASLLQHDPHSRQFSLGSLAFLVFAIVQGKKLHADYWKQAISHALEDGRIRELERAREIANMQKQNAEEAQAAAEEAQATAERAAKVRSEFLANMSHEIRTPMHAIMGMTTLLLDQKLPAETLEYIGIIRSSSDALLTILNDILDISKLESGNVELEHEPLCVYDCVEEILEMLAPKAAENRIELMADIDPDVSDWIFGDPTRLRQILVNLIGNGIKFTNAGEVVVSVRLRDERDGSKLLSVSVRDTGIGIPQEKIDALFQPFSQVDASTTRRFGGTGLGLSISRRLVELMRGTICVESRIGEGSNFRITLPYEPAPPKRTPSTVSEDWRGKRALIVDDNATNRFILSSFLTRWGIITEGVDNAQAALAAVRQNSWDVVLLDCAMPDTDGIQLVHMIKEEFGASAPRMVMLSSGPSNAREAFGPKNNAVAAFLAKPVRRSHLHRVLEQVLSGNRKQQLARVGASIDATFANRMPLSILLAEDNLVNQKMALRLLERFGYRPDAVSNGIEVLEALRRQKYQLVLMDVQMPEMDGLEATRRIVQEWAPGDRPWLTALTASAMKEDREKCIAAGLDDFLTKPLNVRSLEKALARCYVELKQRSASEPAEALDLAPEPVAGELIHQA